MDNAVMGCLIDGHQDLIPAFTLPDPNDRHVLAAAVHCGADAIITYNLRDFPAETLAQYELEAQHPDEFLHHQFGLDPAAVIKAVRNCRARLKNPEKSATEYLSTLELQSLPKIVSELRDFDEII